MTDNQPAAAEEKLSLAGRVNGLVRMIEEVLSPGDVASLRRMRWDEVGCPAFWRLIASHLAGEMPPDGRVREEAERRWTVILQALAELRGLHRGGASLGRTLAEAEIAELRVIKLLRADGEPLFDAVRIIAHHLATKAAPVDTTDLARLVLSAGRRDAEEVRRRVARDFYSQLERNQREARL